MTTQVPEVTFPVEKVPVMDVINPSMINSVKKGITHCIIKSETREILSFCSEDYALISNQEIIESFAKYFEERDINVEMDTWAYNDVRFKMSFKLLDHVEPIQKNDRVFPIFYVLNSYNRTQKYLFGMSVLREVCSNGLTLWVNEQKLDMLHTPGAGEGIAVGESTKLINEFLPAFEETLDPYYELTEREFASIKDLNVRMGEVVENTKFPKMLMEDAQAQALSEINKHGWTPSDWLVYNSLNFQLNHNADNLLGRKADAIDHQVLNYLMNY